MVTKTWMTPKRIARGPEAANAELERWRSVRLEHERARHPGRANFPTVAAMRADEAASRRNHVGSRVVAAPPAKRVDLLDVALVGGLLAGAYMFWRTVRATRIEGVTARSDYERGLDALAAR